MKLVLLIFFILISKNVLADDYSDALTTRGAPQDKVEMEASRKELWYYPKDVIGFANGKLVKFDNSSKSRDSKKTNHNKVLSKKVIDQAKDLLSELKLADKGEGAKPSAPMPPKPGLPGMPAINPRAEIQRIVPEE